MKKTLLLLFLLLSLASNAQLYKFHVATGSVNNDDTGEKMLSDTAGNVYITGWFKETIDMDPSSAVYSISSMGWSYLDIFLAKYNRNGVLLWAKAIGGYGVEQAYDMVLDDSANIFLCGSHDYGFDPDPGAGLPQLNPFGLKDCFFAKYNNNGICQWAKSFGSTQDDQAFAIDIDANHNIYLAGYFSANADFDPSAATANIVNSGSTDAFFAKYDSQGNYVWAKKIDGVNADFAEGIKVAPSGNVYVTGRFQATVDFDPGIDSLYKTVFGFAFYPDAFVAKYDNNGNLIWANQIGGTDFDFSWALQLDAQENVYIAGDYGGTVDFDPGVGTAIISSGGGSYDSFFAKYDSNGNYVWANSFGSPIVNYRDVALSIDVDRFGDVYITGAFAGTADFDCGAGVATMTAPGAGGYTNTFLAKYTTNGNLIWNYQLGGTAHEEGQKLVVNDSGYIFLAGWFMGNNVNFNILAGSNTSNSQGQEDAFFVKYSQLPANAGVITGNTTVCQNGVSSYSVPYIINATTYNWLLPQGASILAGAGTSTISVQFDSLCSNQQITVYGSNAFGNGLSSNFFVTIVPNPIVFFTSLADTICNGNNITIGPNVNGNAPFSYNWSPSSLNVTPVLISPNATTTYTIAVTDANGCITLATHSVVVNPLPDAIISTNDSTLICGNDSVLLYTSPAASDWSYQWLQNNSALANGIDSTLMVYAAGNYSVFLTDGNGCADTVLSITITQQVSCDVWPGDADNTNVVDNNDLLSLGLAYGNSGVARASTSNVWQAYQAQDWGTLQTNNNDMKFADCNGDGTIDMNDTLAVNQNFSLTHLLVTSPIGERLNNPDLYFVLPALSFLPGAIVDAEIWLGNSITPVSNLYGIAFNINYNAAFIQSGTEEIIYTNSWLATPNVTGIKIAKVNPIVNTAFGGEVRINHSNVSGFGKIADFRFQLINNITIAESINLAFSYYKAIDANGTPLMFNPLPSVFTIPVGITELEKENLMNVYPNPFLEQTTISYLLKQNTKVQIELFSPIGQKLETIVNITQEAGMYVYEINSKKNNLKEGIYFVSFSLDGKTVMKKLVVMR